MTDNPQENELDRSDSTTFIPDDILADESEPLLPERSASSTANQINANVLGFAFLAVSLTSFVLQSEVVQFVQGSQSFYKPWFLLYVAHGSYTSCLICQFLYFRLRHGTTLPNHVQDILHHAKNLRGASPISTTGLLIRIFALTVVFTSGSLLWYVSVTRIPMGDVTAIYNTSCFFTYVLSIWLLGSAFKIIKLVAVLTSIAGIFFIALLPSTTETTFNASTFSDDSLRTVGYAAAIISACCVAVYEVLYAKYLVPNPPSAFFSIFVTGMIGLFTLIMGLFLFPLFHYTGIEPIAFPSSGQWLGIAIISFLGIIFNGSFMLVIAWSGPTIAAVGIILTIPLTLLVDSLSMSTHYSWSTFVGSFAILVGYVLLHLN